MLALRTRTTNVSCYVRRWKDWQEISNTNRNDNFASVFSDIANIVPNGILSDVNSIQTTLSHFDSTHKARWIIDKSPQLKSHPDSIRTRFASLDSHFTSSRLALPRPASIFLVQYRMQDEIFIDAHISVWKEKRHDDELLNEITLKATCIQSGLDVTLNASQLTPWQLTQI